MEAEFVLAERLALLGLANLAVLCAAMALHHKREGVRARWRSIRATLRERAPPLLRA